MPRGPRSEKRPADVTGCAIATARLPIGDMQEKLTQASGKVWSGHAGARAAGGQAHARRSPGTRQG